MYEFLHKFLRNMGGIGRLLLYASGACVLGAVLVGGDGRMAFITTGMALGIAGLVFFMIGRQMGGLSGLTQEMRTRGRPGTAKVVGIGDTGVTVNNDPVAKFTLDVTVGDAIPYRVEIRQLVSRVAIGSFQPGATIPVLVDPDDPQQVAIDFSADMPASSALPPMAASLSLEGAKVGSAAELLATGKQGNAVITAMQDMGDISDLGLQESSAPGADDRVFLIQLEVKLPGRDPYTATIGHRVPEHLVGKVGPRTEVVVAVGRGDDQEVAIDWEAVS
ncbi:MAG TPA: DUF3592 domain-containing protein [Acidimicrobiia bacterium]|nr:DUF3592 domain-containing protein [Acidimicrobiia bacterium]